MPFNPKSEYTIVPKDISIKDFPPTGACLRNAVPDLCLKTLQVFKLEAFMNSEVSFLDIRKSKYSSSSTLGTEIK
jgi:hypothetical protein